jgi:pyruvate dehydrogenase E2 component (dihydrolipoamide acetyltransferase)
MHGEGITLAQAIVMPKLGNTAESAIILAWHVELGDIIGVGDLLCEVETDKATMDIESTADGVLLARMYREGDEAPVLSNIAVIGEEGESIAEFIPNPRSAAGSAGAQAPFVGIIGEENRAPNANVFPKISPRARNLARRKGIQTDDIQGSGPDGRIIQRDIEAAMQERVVVTPVAQAMLDSGDYQLADEAQTAGRLGKRDLAPVHEADGSSRIPLRGIRKTIAKRMLDSLQSTAQLTLNASADARALQAFRQRLKASDERLGLRDVNLNDLLLFAVARTTADFPDLNALFENDAIYQHNSVQLGLAVDTDRGLLVPVIADADRLNLKQLAAEAHRLADACRSGDILPDELTGGTFTVSNLGALGIESFTPILNPPQVAILGIGAIYLKPVQAEDRVEFLPHIGLSLTINHQAVDGAPAARFLQKLQANLSAIDLLAAGMQG